MKVSLSISSKIWCILLLTTSVILLEIINYLNIREIQPKNKHINNANFQNEPFHLHYEGNFFTGHPDPPDPKTTISQGQISELHEDYKEMETTEKKLPNKNSSVLLNVENTTSHVKIPNMHEYGRDYREMNTGDIEHVKIQSKNNLGISNSENINADLQVPIIPENYRQQITVTDPKLQTNANSGQNTMITMSQSNFPQNHKEMLNIDEKSKFISDILSVEKHSSDSPLAIPRVREDECNSCFQHNFEYLIGGDSVCKLYSPNQVIDLIIVIFSRFTGKTRRNLVRKTWTKPYINNKSNIRYIFILGTSFGDFSDHMNRVVFNESLEHQDIIQENFQDSYNNLTLKLSMALKWVSEKCSHAKYFLKTDDDVWINIPRILEIVKKEKDFLEEGLGGECKLKSSPIRDATSKFYISEEEYPNPDFPPYCVGAAYITSLFVVRKMYVISHNTPPIPWEDVYSGMLIVKLKLKVKSLFWIDGNIMKACQLTNSTVAGHRFLSPYLNSLCPTTYVKLS